MKEVLTVLDDLIRGIDYLLTRTEILDGPLGNGLRLDLHSARQNVVNLSQQQIGGGSSAVEEGTAASGALGAANVSGTGAGPQPTVEQATAPEPAEASLTNATQAPASIPQAAWDALPPDARAAILADAGKGSPTPLIKTPDLGALAPEDEAGAVLPPWMPADGARSAS